MTWLIAGYAFVAWIVLVQVARTESLPQAIAEAVFWPLVLVIAYTAAGVDALTSRR